MQCKELGLKKIVFGRPNMTYKLGVFVIFVLTVRFLEGCEHRSTGTHVICKMNFFNKIFYQLNK